MTNGAAIESSLLPTESGGMTVRVPLSLAEQIPGIIVAIGATLPTLPAATQKVLLRIFKDTKHYDEPFTDAVKELVSASPTLMAFESQATKESEVRHAATGPFLFWALSQPWASTTPLEEIGRVLSHWSSQLGANRYSASPMAAGFMAGVALPLLDTRLSMSTAKKTKLRAKFLEIILSPAGFSTLHKWSTDLSHPLLINLGLLAQSCANENVDYKMASAVWDDAVKKTMLGMKNAGQEAFLKAIEASALTSTYKLRACMQSSTGVWLEPTLISCIASLLPADENARLPQLNWFDRKSSLLDAEARRFNQGLVAAYCPQLHTLLDLALAPADWASHATIVKRLREFTTQKAVLALPADMEFSCGCSARRPQPAWLQKHLAPPMPGRRGRCLGAAPCMFPSRHGCCPPRGCFGFVQRMHAATAQLPPGASWPRMEALPACSIKHH